MTAARRRSFRAINIYCLAALFTFIPNTRAYIDIKGELSFDLFPINGDVLKNVRDNKIVIESEALHQKARSTKATTAGVHNTSTTDNKTVKATTADDCVYQYPDKKQIEALLSDMMNQLTKIFIRAYDYISRRLARRGGKRFKIVGHKFNSSFFEEAYSLMTKEYRQSINATGDILRQSSRDPCHHQAEVKELWRRLLERSKAILKRAAVRCVSDFLRVRNRADDARTKEKLAQLLLREIREVRSNQLKVLCDNFNLCYKDLLY